MSPMPGLVKTVSCKVGDTVGEGQEVLVIGKSIGVVLILRVLHEENKKIMYFFFIKFCRGNEDAKQTIDYLHRQSEICFMRSRRYC